MTDLQFNLISQLINLGYKTPTAAYKNRALVGLAMRKQNFLQAFAAVTKTKQKKAIRDRFCFAAKDVTGRSITNDVGEPLANVVKYWHDKAAGYSEEELVDEILDLEHTDDSPTIVLAAAILAGDNIDHNLAVHKRILKEDGFTFVADTSATQYTRLALAYIGACLEITDSNIMAFEFVSRCVMLMRMQDAKMRNKKLYGWLVRIADELSNRV
jgi:hypothetical protein